jgi:hypothetical protein
LANHAGVALRSNADESKGFYGAFDKRIKVSELKIVMKVIYSKVAIGLE